nr:MAG TPA: hypothetical protein [Caudoviricetes sp.]
MEANSLSNPFPTLYHFVRRTIFMPRVAASRCNRTTGSM